MAEDSGEKTEEATDKKIQDSRKRGMVWKSHDLTGLAVFLTGLGVLKATWSGVEHNLRELFLFSFDRLAHPHDLSDGLVAAIYLGIRDILMLTVPVVTGAALVGALTEFLQVGPLFSAEVLMPKLEKLNPLQGMKNLVSKKQFIELIKSTLKISIAGYVVFGAVKGSLDLVARSVDTTPQQTMALLFELIFRVVVRVALLLMMFAIFDVWFQHRNYKKELMMTKEEVKKEYKESEGDPQHKAKRKELHQEILEGAATEQVKGADVVVTNPDHVAVALKYDQGRDEAPRLLAKGLDQDAEAIKALAAEAGVPIMRNVPLARALLSVELGAQIPENLYDAVAEVLNFVYGL